jgi:heat shock protein HslJ
MINKNFLILVKTMLVMTVLYSGETTLDPEKNKQLEGTDWQLVEFQSMDDAIGTKRPTERSLYTMSLKSDGNVTMKLNCNRAMGSWTYSTSSDGISGKFRFDPLAGTRMLCPPPSMDEDILMHSEYIRSYLLKDGKLYLSLMADGGIYVWEPKPNTNDLNISSNNMQTSDTIIK